MLVPFLASFTYKTISKDESMHIHTHTLAYTVPEPNSASLLDKIRPKFIVNVSPEMLHNGYQNSLSKSQHTPHKCQIDSLSFTPWYRSDTT